MSRIVLLGPQRERVTVGQVLDDLGVTGNVATITAGWQDWESDDGALNAHIGRPTVNLRLYARAEEVWAADPELRVAHRTVQDRLRTLRRLYNRRLTHLANSWMELLTLGGPEDILGPERESALESIRVHDAHHLARIVAERKAFLDHLRPLERPAVAEHRAEIRETIADCDAVVVEGGHVALLHNRLRLFGMAELFAGRPLVACSGAAMVLGERVVLFHDTPPSGPGHTEVALPGLGLHSGLVPLPHARTRLRLDDPARVARLASRLAPDRCVVLGPGTRLDWDGSDWRPVDVDQLSADGSVRPWRAAA